MADRFRPAHLGGGGGGGRPPPPSRTGNPPNHAAPPSAAPTNNNTTVRRNLFQSQLTRRPTGPAPAVAPAINSDSDPPSSPSVASAAETLRLDDPRAAHALLFPTGSGNDYGMRSPTDARSAGGGGVGGGGGLGFPDEDIVIRDKNGELELSGDPASPDVGGGGGGGNPGGGGGEEEDDEEAAAAAEAAAAVEAEKERQRLAEAVRQHQVDQNSVPVQPEELLEAVRASLKAKVAALADDNWMFEREDLPRHR